MQGFYIGHGVIRNLFNSRNIHSLTKLENDLFIRSKIDYLIDDKSCFKFYILQLVCIILRNIRVKISVVTADEAVKLSGQTRAPP